MADFRREALIRTLQADYGITTVEELLDGMSTRSGLATTVTFGTGQAVWDSISAMTP